jgi:predicted flap endonuclease-1-like 5' DNA nuclease/uncharacterized membrane-anchored protein YhcB (DUF1043 family)
MVAYLLGVAFLGIIVGWLFTRSSSQRRFEDAEVNLLSRLHDVQKELDISRQQLDKTSALLEEEKSLTTNTGDYQALVLELDTAQTRNDLSKDQIMELSSTLDSVTTQLRKTRGELEKQQKHNIKLKRDFDTVKNRLTVFQDDLVEIADNSEQLRAAFDDARMQLVDKDRRIAELESASSEGMQLAALTNNSSEPELAISRIARLQNRVQELFDEVSRKDEELEKLKGATIDTINSHEDHSSTEGEVVDIEMATNDDSSSPSNLEESDDLTQINGIDDLLEDRLKALGVIHLKEIADWEADDIDHIDTELRNFPGRIQTERWVEQARDICILNTLGTSH